MDDSRAIATRIDKSIHHIPSIAYIVGKTGGVIFTNSEIAFRFIQTEVLNHDLIFMRGNDAYGQFGERRLLVKRNWLNAGYSDPVGVFNG
jgi:hypothetical protein